jgi:hypothetical protein
LIRKIAGAIKAHIPSTLKVPPPTLVAFGISTTVTFVIFTIFYMFDTGIMGIGAAEAAPKYKPNCC